MIQASTAFWPGYTERIELHGTKGTAVIAGDKLVTWDVENDEGEPPPSRRTEFSGAADPMAISTEPFERQFRDFGEAIRTGRKPLLAGEDGLAGAGDRGSGVQLLPHRPEGRARSLARRRLSRGGAGG